MEKKKKESIIRRASKAIAQLQKSMREKRDGTGILYIVLRLSVILLAVRAGFQGNFEYVALCVLVLLLFLAPSFIEKQLNIDLPSTLEKIILLFAYAAEILGEIQAFYIKIPWWDTMLHTLNGFLCAAVGFALVDILNREKKIQFELSPVFCAIVAICFSMTVGIMWEFFEYGVDCIFKLDMQKDTVIPMVSSTLLNPNGENVAVIFKDITSTTINGQELPINGYLDIGLHDTMEDLLVNFIGAVVFSFFGYRYMSTKGNDKFASQFIPITNEEESEGTENAEVAGETDGRKLDEGSQEMDT